MAKEDGIDLEAIIRVEKIPEEKARDKVKYLRGYEKKESSMTIKDINHQYHLHEQAIEAHTILTCKELGLPADDQYITSCIARWHDVGKLHPDMPQYVWNKTEKLNDADWEIIRKHPEYSAEMIEIFPNIKNGALHHHENYDGTGYPHHLSGKSIPITSQIVFAADTFSAMTHKRGYNTPKTPIEAAKEILRCRYTQFDPDVADAFIKILQFLGKIPKQI